MCAACREPWMRPVEPWGNPPLQVPRMLQAGLVRSHSRRGEAGRVRRHQQEEGRRGEAEGAAVDVVTVVGALDVLKDAAVERDMLLFRSGIYSPSCFPRILKPRRGFSACVYFRKRGFSACVYFRKRGFSACVYLRKRGFSAWKYLSLIHI